MAAWSLSLSDAVADEATSRAAGPAVPLLDWLSLLRCYFHQPLAQVIEVLRSCSCLARTARAKSMHGSLSAVIQLLGRCPRAREPASRRISMRKQPESPMLASCVEPGTGRSSLPARTVTGAGSLASSSVLGNPLVNTVALYFLTVQH